MYIYIWMDGGASSGSFTPLLTLLILLNSGGGAGRGSERRVGHGIETVGRPWLGIEDACNAAGGPIYIYTCVSVYVYMSVCVHIHIYMLYT